MYSAEGGGPILGPRPFTPGAPQSTQPFNSTILFPERVGSLQPNPQFTSMGGPMIGAAPSQPFSPSIGGAMRPASETIGGGLNLAALRSALTAAHVSAGLAKMTKATVFHSPHGGYNRYPSAT